VICKRRKPHIGLTCTSCHDRIHQHLRDIPIAYKQAENELVPGGGGHAGGTEQSIGLRIGALDLRHGAGYINELGQWARQWREDGITKPSQLEYVCDINYHWRDGINSTQPDERGHQAPPNPEYSALHATLRRYGKGTPERADLTGVTLTAVVDELLIGLHEACKRFDGIDEFATAIATLSGQATSASRTAPRQAWVIPCPTDRDDDGDTTRCGLPLRVTGEDLHSVVECPRCLTHWDVQRLLLVAESDSATTVWLPADEIDLLLNIPEQTLRRWARDPNNPTIRERGRYDVASVREAIATRDARKQRRA